MSGLARDRTELLLLVAQGLLLLMAIVTLVVTRGHSVMGPLLLLAAIAVSYWVGLRRRARR